MSLLSAMGLEEDHKINRHWFPGNTCSQRALDSTLSVFEYCAIQRIPSSNRNRSLDASRLPFNSSIDVAANDLSLLQARHSATPTTICIAWAWSSTFDTQIFLDRSFLVRRRRQWN